MRRLLADLVEGRTLGDATSLQDAAVLGRIRRVLDASPR
jgi:acetyl-CoA synthetase